jgi:hypothetical protein
MGEVTEFPKKAKDTDLETISYKEFKKQYHNFKLDDEGHAIVDIDKQIKGEEKLSKLVTNLSENWNKGIQDSYQIFHKKLQDKFGPVVDKDIKIKDHKDYALNALAESLVEQLSSLSKEDGLKHQITKETLEHINEKNYKDKEAWRTAVFSAYSRFCPMFERNEKGQATKKINLIDEIINLEQHGKLSDLYALFDTRHKDLVDNFAIEESNSLYTHVKEDHWNKHLLSKLKSDNVPYSIDDHFKFNQNAYGESLKQMTKGVVKGLLNKETAKQYGLKHTPAEEHYASAKKAA